MKIKINDPRGTRGRLKVGQITKTKAGLLFRKDVDKSKHYMKITKGYGIQKAVFDEYLRGKKGRIVLKETDGDKVTWLVASIKTWTNNSSSQNFGDGKQVFLSRRFMHNADDFDRSVINQEPEETIQIDRNVKYKALKQALERVTHGKKKK